VHTPREIEVVICTYNRAAMLDRTLSSLAGQRSLPDVAWSVLVVDNNCVDDTPAVVERHRQAGVPVSISREPTQGLTAARRHGIAHSTAPWVAFVDDDCVLDSSWIANAAAFARAHPDCGAFGGRVRLEWERAPREFVLRFPWAYAAQDHGPRPRRVPLLVGAGMIVHREALERSGWTRRQFLDDRTGERLVSGGDVELALRIGAGHELWYTPACELRHVISADRVSLGYLRRVVFGLGACKFFEDSMLWSGTYEAWRRAAFARAGRYARRVGRDAYLTLVGRRHPADVALRLSFVGGWMLGMWRLERWSPSERDAIVGCAIG
jgi:glycosyltransferase involved in cell wall biosynthesis